MPWVTDANGEKSYQPSIYAKEELPTWLEMYEEFFQKKCFSYSPEVAEDQVPDPYWKIPRKKVLLAAACNQLNKMIFEDGLKKRLVDFITKTHGLRAEDIKFTLEPIPSDEWAECLTKCNVGTPDPPPIYTYPLPTGKENPFITSTRVPRIDISQLNKELKIFPIIMYGIGGDEVHKSVSAPTHDDYLEAKVDQYNAIMAYILEEMIIYFGGEGVGWKDADGHLIKSDPTKPSYDPAL